MLIPFLKYHNRNFATLVNFILSFKNWFRLWENKWDGCYDPIKGDTLYMYVDTPNINILHLILNNTY